MINLRTYLEVTKLKGTPKRISHNQVSLPELTSKKVISIAEYLDRQEVHIEQERRWVQG